MAFYVYITTIDHRRIKVGHFMTRDAAVIAQGDLSRIESIEISSDVLSGATT